MNSKIIIAGAGVGGLTAALCLLERGFDVEVLEQSRLLGPVGAGIQLSANATRVLFGVGLESGLRAVNFTPAGKRIRLWSTGREWKLFDLGGESISRYGYPYMMVYRPDLHEVLVDALRKRRAGALVLDAKIVDVTQTADAVCVRLADGRSMTADGLVGADGVHSVVRAKCITDDKPRFSGCIAWRGVVPIQALPGSMREPYGVNWVGPGAHVVHYPIHAGRLVAFAGIVERQGWYRESWSESGSVNECMADFSSWHPDIHALIQRLDRPLRWALMVRTPLTNWTNGRVTLLGDAAHPTLPFMAQGACMAIEDGCILARSLAEHPRDTPRAWLLYQASRLERTTQIVLQSELAARRFHNAELADPAQAEAYINREWDESKTLSRYGWLFSYQAEAVALGSSNSTAP